MFDYFNNMSYAGYQFWKLQMGALLFGVLFVIVLIVWAIDSFKKWRRERNERWRRKQMRR